MKEVNIVIMDSIVEKILIDYENNKHIDIFETIHEHLGVNYSLDDLVDFIQDKDTLKKKFAIIFVAQNYNRSYIGKLIQKEILEDLF